MHWNNYPQNHTKHPLSATVYLQQQINDVGWNLVFSVYNFFLLLEYRRSLNINNINNILRVKHLIPNYWIYRNVIPPNLNWLLSLVVAK